MKKPQYFIFGLILGLLMPFFGEAQDLYGQDQTSTFEVYNVGLSGKLHQTIDMSEVEITHQDGQIKQVIIYDMSGDDIQIEPLNINEGF